MQGHSASLHSHGVGSGSAYNPGNNDQMHMPVMPRSRQQHSAPGMYGSIRGGRQQEVPAGSWDTDVYDASAFPYSQGREQQQHHQQQQQHHHQHQHQQQWQGYPQDNDQDQLRQQQKYQQQQQQQLQQQQASLRNSQGSHGMMPPQNLAMSQGSRGQNLHKSQGGQILSTSSGSHGMMPPQNLAMSQGSRGMIYSQNMTVSQGRQNLAMSHGSQGLTYSGMLSQSSSSNSTTYDKGMMLGDSSKSMSSTIASMASTLSLNSHSQQYGSHRHINNNSNFSGSSSRNDGSVVAPPPLLAPTLSRATLSPQQQQQQQQQHHSVIAMSPSQQQHLKQQQQHQLLQQQQQQMVATAQARPALGPRSPVQQQQQKAGHVIAAHGSLPPNQRQQQQASPPMFGSNRGTSNAQRVAVAVPSPPIPVTASPPRPITPVPQVTAVTPPFVRTPSDRAVGGALVPPGIASAHSPAVPGLVTTSLPAPTPPPVPTLSAPAREYSWLFATPPITEASKRYQMLRSSDEYYFDNPHRIQRVCVKLNHVLDPTSLVKSLVEVAKAFPLVSSTVSAPVAAAPGEVARRRFNLDTERVTVQLVVVSPWMMSNQSVWCSMLERHRVASPGKERPPLFQAFLMRCVDPSYGCALVLGFDHVLGDGGSYGMFMKRWSDAYQKEVERCPPKPQAVHEVPPSIFPHEDDCFSKIDFTKTLHRWTLSPSMLKTFKAVLGKERVSTNDINMAQAVCALGPLRMQPGDGATKRYCRLALLVDQRGRGLPEGWFGNGVADINVQLSWDKIIAGDVAGLAIEIRQCITQDLADMQGNVEAFNANKTKRAQDTRLFCWNSWVNAGRMMLDSTFGHKDSVQVVEWLNMNHVNESSVILAMPVKDGSLMLQVACCTQAEVDALSKYWGKAHSQAVVGF